MNLAEQQHLVALAREIVRQAPLYTATTKSGAKFAYRQTGAGIGWISDSKGYRYSDRHPITGAKLPTIPAEFLAIAAAHGCKANALLLNFYGATGKLGMHVDRDEGCAAPVVSLSLGDDAIFLLGGKDYMDAPQRITLRSGDIITLAGPTRFAYHGIERIIPGSNPGLLKAAGRINITLRQLA